MPIDTAKGAAANVQPSSRMPASLAPSGDEIVGPFERHAGRAEIGDRRARAPRPRRSRVAARSATAQGETSSALAWKLPVGERQSRPWRPRPAVCRSATIHSRPGSPASARRLASSLVESEDGEALDPPALDRVATRRVLAFRQQRPQNSDLRRRQRRRSERRGDEHAKDQHRRRQPEHDALRRLRRVERLGGLVEIHDLDDAQIVEGAHRAQQHADDGEAVEPGLDRRGEHIELGEEAGERRNAGEREHHRRQEERHRRVGARKPRQIGDGLDIFAVAAHRQDAGECSQRHHQIDRHIERDALRALDRAGREADQREAHMADRGIGHQPLDVGLPDRREGAERHRGDRDEDDDLPPLRRDMPGRRSAIRAR